MLIYIIYASLATAESLWLHYFWQHTTIHNLLEFKNQYFISKLAKLKIPIKTTKKP